MISFVSKIDRTLYTIEVTHIVAELLCSVNYLARLAFIPEYLRKLDF